MFNYINRVLVGLRNDEDGQTFVEYALILGVVAVTFAALNAADLGAAIQNSVTQVTNALGA
jgi:Flp pilus assembly pilin Flp